MCFIARFVPISINSCFAPYLPPRRTIGQIVHQCGWGMYHHSNFSYILYIASCVLAGIRQLGANPLWPHQTETYTALLALCAGNSPVTSEFPSERPVTRRFDVFFNLCLNKLLSKQSRGWWFETPSRSPWCHCSVQGNSSNKPPCHLSICSVTTDTLMQDVSKYDNDLMLNSIVSEHIFFHPVEYHIYWIVFD